MNTDTRTDAELNRIIAEWMGWRFVPETPSGAPVDYEPEHWLDENGRPTNWFFCEDLNAIHEAALKAGPHSGYTRALRAIVLQHGEDSSLGDFYYYEAEARQRAEALVAVIQAS